MEAPIISSHIFAARSNHTHPFSAFMILTANALGYGSSVITAPLGTLNGEEHDTWCMQFGVDINMNAVAVLLIGAIEATSDAQHDIEELMFEKLSYVQ